MRKPGGVLAVLLLALAACSSGPHPPTSLLDDRALIYGSEIGAWQHDGGPAVEPSTGVPAKIRAARIPVIRYALPDCFTDLRCGSDDHRGTIRRADFDRAVRGITGTDKAVLWLKLVPISAGLDNGAVFCPPWRGDARGNLPMYEAELAEVRHAGYRGPLIVELNSEMDYTCWRTWRAQGAPITGPGSPGVSRRIGEHYAANAGPLRDYATKLGFAQVVLGAYLGVSGGPRWGQDCVPARGAPYGYRCGYQPRWVDEFNRAVLAAGAAPPDFESIHAYPHSADFAAPPYVFDDRIAYSYYRTWIIRTRGRLVALWGPRRGNAVRLSISEWNAGTSGSGGTWPGWTEPGRPAAFYRGWLRMLAGNGVLSGSGTRYWSANVFLVAGNSDQGSGRYYNLIRADGSTPPWYAVFRRMSSTDPRR